MARPKPRSITHLGVEGSPLDAEKQEALIAYLKEIGLSQKGAEAFARGVNSVIVGAYVLDPNMASRKERIAFVERVVRDPETLDDVLISDADCYNRHPNRIAISDDVRAIKESVSLEKAVDRLKGTLVRPGRGPRGPQPAQALVNDLAKLWRQCLGEQPTCDCWTGVSNSPFVRMLQWVVPEAEMYYLGKRREKNIYNLGKMAQRAIEYMQTCDRTFGNYDRHAKNTK